MSFTESKSPNHREYHYVPKHGALFHVDRKEDYNIASALSIYLDVRKQNIKWKISGRENINGILPGSAIIEMEIYRN